MGRITGLTTAIYGKIIGRPPLGPPDPGQQPLRPYIAGNFFNIQARTDPGWAAEEKYQKAILPRPNPAPVGVSWMGRATKTVTPQSRGMYPVPQPSPGFGPVWAGSEGAPSFAGELLAGLGV